jgi:hypothetical protein
MQPLGPGLLFALVLVVTIITVLLLPSRFTRLREKPVPLLSGGGS